MSNAAVGLEPRDASASRGAGAFQFVLHSHLPYCRLAGRWPHGEEWLHEALAETYIPLLNVLYDLYERGIRGKMTLSLSPVLVEQLADADVCEHFLQYLDEEIEMASRDLARLDPEAEAQPHYLASYYRAFYEDIKTSFTIRYRRDVIGAFRKLQDAGCIEISTCAATHGYLPLLSRDSSIYAQVRTAVASYVRHFGRPPRAMWLPECAYRPARLEADGTVRPGIEGFLAAQGIACFFVETSSVEKGRPGYRPRGAIGVGPYALAERRFQAEAPASGEDARIELSTEPAGSTYQAYAVAEPDGTITVPPVAVIGRNERTGMQVWSADWGYPGDADYREFHRKDAVSGLQYWRVTSPEADLGQKDTYHPDWAAAKVASHALHFGTLVEELLVEYRTTSGEYGLISSNYDTELFGHWWFEGVTWIGKVLEHLSQSDTVDLTTTSEYLNANWPRRAIAIPEGSWGAGGTHWTWDNPDTHWMWTPIHASERKMESLVARYPDASGDQLRMLNQAARELLLLESSDWPFLVTTGQAREYATGRFQSHLERYDRLVELLEAGNLAEGAVRAAEYYQKDNVFPDIDYRWFAERQGRVS
jgi:1,4-alpha-glucan branching enzyme